MMLLDDAVRDREPKTYAGDLLLCGEKGIEDPLSMFGQDPGAAISDVHNAKAVD